MLDKLKMLARFSCCFLFGRILQEPKVEALMACLKWCRPACHQVYARFANRLVICKLALHANKQIHNSFQQAKSGQRL